MSAINPAWDQPPTREELQQFLLYSERANQIAATRDSQNLRHQALRLILEYSGAVAGILCLIDTLSQRLVLRSARGYGEQDLNTFPQLNLGQKLVHTAREEQRPILLTELEPESKWLGGLEAFALKGTRRALALPIYQGEEFAGIFLLFNPNQTSLPLIQLLANRLATELDRSLKLDVQQTRINRLNALIAVLGQMGANLDRGQILRMVINYAPVLLNAEASSLFLIDSESRDLILYHASSNQNLRVGEIRVPAGKGIIGTVVDTGQTIIVNDVKSDNRHFSDADDTTGFSTRSILAVPLTTRVITLGSERRSTTVHTIGGMEVLNKLDGHFTEEDAQLFRSLANQAATGLAIADIYDDAEKLLEGVLEALAAAIDAKDPYTQDHSKRVRDFSIEVAKEMGYLDRPDQDEIGHYRQIWIGSLLHDIGKIGIPDVILSKEDRLTPQEYLQIKQHPIIGRHILEPVPQLRDGLAAIAQHHEHLDGSGYPDQLKDEQISLTARIVAVADVFDAMTSDRPYRKALPIQEVFEYMREVAGKHLDGDCVEALIRAYRTGKIQTQKMRELAQTRPLRSPH
ncbi:MAG: HD domain-containing phosphohydrolase [Anaerolineales bacterium]|jgi:HD-GYP domain-containing protein (c-di-GMP phosphodiesterase class II)